MSTKEHSVDDVLETLRTGYDKEARNKTYTGRFAGINPEKAKLGRVELDNYHEVLFENLKKQTDQAKHDLYKLISERMPVQLKEYGMTGSWRRYSDKYMDGHNDCLSQVHSLLKELFDC